MMYLQYNKLAFHFNFLNEYATLITMENKPVQLTLFVLQMCPFCVRARNYLKELLEEEKYRHIQIKLVDEAKERAYANAHDYYLVPTFYLGSTKLLEGRMTKEDVRSVLDRALEMN